jgi:PHS family inorganic phosphate transporter-like MFS transporter
VLKDNLGLRGTLLLTAGVSALGALLTLVLPEPSGRSLEDISGHHDVVTAAERVLADENSPTTPTRPATVAEA